MVRQFTINKYLNQTRDESVLYLPSYWNQGWHHHETDTSKRLLPGNYHYIYSMFKYLIPSQSQLPTTQYMSSYQLEQRQIISQQNEYFQANYNITDNNHQITRSISELQINYFIPYKFEPFFNYGQFMDILKEFRKYLITFYESQFYGYNWIQDLIHSDYFCFAFNHTMKCNNRSDFNITLEEMNEIDMISNLQSIINVGPQNRNESELKIMFVGDRWVCHNNSCKCTRRRCDYPKIHNNYFSQIISTFSKSHFIVYGNPAYIRFETHYNLMRNTDIFISAHGASFALSAFMYPPQKLFEFTTKSAEHIAKAMELEYHGYPLKYRNGTYIAVNRDYGKPISFNVTDAINHISKFLLH